MIKKLPVVFAPLKVLAVALLVVFLDPGLLRAETTIAVDGNVSDWARSDAQCALDNSGGTKYVDILKICATDASSTTGYFYFYLQFNRNSGNAAWLQSAGVFLNVDYNNDGVVDAVLDMIALAAPQANGVISLPYLEMAVLYSLVDPQNDGNFSFSITTKWNGSVVDNQPNSGFINYVVDPATGSPRAVRMLSQEAVARDNGVNVLWKTASERQNAGYHVYRRISKKAPWEQLTDTPIPGLGNAPFGREYRFVDASGVEGDMYRIVDVDFTGVQTGHRVLTASLPQTNLWSSVEKMIPRYERQVSFEDRISRFYRKIGKERRPSSALQGSIRFAVDTSGLQFISAATLEAAGIPLRRATVSRNGHRVAVLTKKEGVYFYGAARVDRYADHEVYSVSSGPVDGMKSVKTQSRCRSFLRALPQEQTIAANREYYVATPTADPFYAGSAFSGVPFVESFDLPGMRSNAGVLEVDLVGFAQDVEGPDHLASVTFNGVFLGDFAWEGTGLHTLRAPLPAGLLRAVGNQLQVASPPDAIMDMLSVDAMRITGQRTLDAAGAEFEFTAPADSCIEIAGVVRGGLILDITDADAPVVVQRVFATEGKVQMRVPSGKKRGEATERRFLLTSLSLADSPELQGQYRRAGAMDARGGADYIIITHALFADAANQLAAHHRNRDLDTRVVDVDDLYDYFSFGRPSPSAISDFLKEASNTWANPPKFVLLMGGATADSNDVLGTGDADYIPTYFYRTKLFGYEAASDVAYVQGLSPMTIGRIAARSAEEANGVVAKIIENAQAPGRTGKSLYIADKDDTGAAPGMGLFEQSAQSQMNVSGGFAADSIALHLRSEPAGRSRFTEFANAGMDVVNYHGHAYLSGWSQSPQLATLASARALKNDHLFVLLSWSCFDGAFVGPWDDSLAWEFVSNPDGGAVAALAGSSLSNPNGVEHFARAVTERLAQGVPTLGEALQQAKQKSELIFGTDMSDTLATYNLLGDPATPNPWR